MRHGLRMKKETFPAMLTLSNAACGFLAIIFAFNLDYHLSAIMIIVAFIFDLLDGMVSRRLGAVTKLGGELDSFADSISFVVAPALLVYSRYFTDFTIGIIVVLFIVVCGILRLAKFNITKGTKHFAGMPTPYFAAVVIAFILGDVALSEEIIAIIFLILSYMMVSPLKYPGFKDKGTIKYRYAGMIILGFLAIALILNIDILAVIIMEYVLLWALLLIPALFDKTFASKTPIVAFEIGLLLLIILLYSNQKLLLVLPLIYFAIASPLIQMSLRES